MSVKILLRTVIQGFGVFPHRVYMTSIFGQSNNLPLIASVLIVVGFQFHLSYLRQNCDLSFSAISGEKRVAILISGQPRSLGLNSADPLFPTNLDPMTLSEKFPEYRPSGYAAVARSIQENLYQTLSNFDVFFLVEFPEGTPQDIMAERGATYCDLLKPTDSKNQLVCDIKIELPVHADHNSVVWANFVYAGQEKLILGLLHQLYGMYQVNKMRKEFELTHAIKYEYMIRLRPDVGVFKSFPSVTTLNFGVRSAPKVLTASKACCCGNEDWFGVGRTEVMDLYFDRYLHIQATYNEWVNDSQVWAAEHFVELFIKNRLNASLEFHPEIFACVVKPTNRVSPSQWLSDPVQISPPNIPPPNPLQPSLPAAPLN